MPRPKSKPTPAPKRGRGQPEKEIDLKQVEAICQLQVTDEELASVLGVSRKTIERRKERDDFREAMERGRSKGLVSLRRAQYQTAIGGNATMLIWLGKIWAGQKDPSLNKEVAPDVNAPKPSIKIGLPDGGEVDAKPLNADSLISAGKVLPVQ